MTDRERGTGNGERGKTAPVTFETPARARHALRTPPKPPSTIGSRFPVPGSRKSVEPDAARQRVTVGIPPEILKQVKLIELRTRGLVNSVFSGEYRSVFKGQGMEFAEVREYQPGDEVRSIDWNVTARMRRPSRCIQRFVTIPRSISRRSAWSRKRRSWWLPAATSPMAWRHSPRRRRRVARI